MSLVFRRGSPPSDLKPLVRDVWTLRGAVSGLVPPEPVLPDGYPELVFNRADPFARTTGAGGWEIQPTALLVGPQTTAAWIRPTGVVDLIGVRLEPWALGLIAGHPASELRDTILALDDVVGRGVAGLATGPLSAGADRVFGWIRRRWREASAGRVAAVERLAAIGGQWFPRGGDPIVDQHGRRSLGGGNRSIGGSGLGTSRRQLERLFQDHLGLAPGLWRGIRRFQRAAAVRRVHPDWSWARVAAATGYVDQAHLTREFRRYAGVTPGRHRPAEAGLTDWFLDLDRVA